MNLVENNTDAFNQRGFQIERVQSGPIIQLSFKPQEVVTTEESIATAISFFNNFLYNLPDKMKDCRSHFKTLYDHLPKNSSYYYLQETHYNLDGNPINKYCLPLGVGEDITDAYSTYLLSPHIEPDKSAVFSENGTFVKASFTGNSMNFENMNTDYALQKKMAHVKSREKLKKITLAMPLDDAPIPSTLQYSTYWSTITIKYERELKEQNTYDRMKQLNQQFEATEKEFYNNVKLYREYKKRQAEAIRSAAMISLILQGASIAATSYSSQNELTLKNEINQLKQNQEALTIETQKANQKAIESLRKANEIKNYQLNELKQHHIPLNDDPKIDVIWQNELG
jgi:hypothetical protein